MTKGHVGLLIATFVALLSATATGQRITATRAKYPHVSQDGRVDYIVYAGTADYQGEILKLNKSLSLSYSFIYILLCKRWGNDGDLRLRIPLELQ